MSEGTRTNGNIDVDKVIDYVKLTKKQRKALESLKKAFKRCRKLEIKFWANYDHLDAYNSKKMTEPLPDEEWGDIYLSDRIDIYVLEEIKEAGIVSGTADDPAYFNLKGRKIPRKEDGD